MNISTSPLIVNQKYSLYITVSVKILNDNLNGEFYYLSYNNDFVETIINQ